MATTPPWADGVLHFWLKELGPDRWWVRSPQTDATIIERFGALWEAQRTRHRDDFLANANTALAALLLFDQFSRNMFRGQAMAFATDSLARDIARAAIARGFDTQTGGPGRAFFYLPFMHSEDIADQQLSLRLFDQPGLEYNLEFARQHHDMIVRFGRFPHRNAALGRADAPGEAEAIAQGNGW